MPRKPRIDEEGYLYHVIARGIERRNIFHDDADRDFFLSRMGKILMETETPIHAFALMPNHIHLLVRRTGAALSTVMRRLLTCYALYFNRRNDRAGHVFQNRYHSVVCQEEPYYFELLRYIHLNPIRAGYLSSLRELAKYPYSGHAYIMGGCVSKWFDPDPVLASFNDAKDRARRSYAGLVANGMKLAEIDLDGGGRMRIQRLDPRQGSSPPSGFDARVLGDQVFVDRLRRGNRETAVLAEYDAGCLIASVCAQFGISRAELTGASKRRKVVEAREVAAFRMSTEAGLPWSCIARELAVSRSAVTKIMHRMSICDLGDG
ncbi:MAG: transposase [Thermoleophilia bacterium]